MNKKQIFFPGLNGLRFFAALFALITHLELFKYLNGFSNNWSSPLILSFGSIGVDLFFVLSGFLITYLLLAEKGATGDISLRQFYIRRILRIWPLYFFIVVLTFLIIPLFPLFPLSQGVKSHYFGKLSLYSFMLPNVALAFFPGVSYATMTWSVGVEEQFYLFWPLLIKTTKKLVFVMVGVISFFSALKLVIFFLMHWQTGRDYTRWKDLIVMTRIECMALGGLGAYLLFYKKDAWLNIIYSPVCQWICFLGIIPATYLLIWLGIDDIKHWVYSLLFLGIILNVASNPEVVINFEKPLLNRLGKISYGIYMYQYLSIVISISVVKQFISSGDMLLFNIFYYGMSFIITILISQLSYKFLELRFIKMKPRFSSIVSGDLAKSTVEISEKLQTPLLLNRCLYSLQVLLSKVK
jgi:peptidoglycan/LPS O-acetylase OafA/YrhL